MVQLLAGGMTLRSRWGGSGGNREGVSGESEHVRRLRASESVSGGGAEGALSGQAPARPQVDARLHSAGSGSGRAGPKRRPAAPVLPGGFGV